MSEPTTLRRRWTALRARLHPLMVVPLLVLLALGGWAFASPVGGSPDDDFHLASIWCADVVDPDCAPGDESGHRLVPEGVVHAGCYNRLPEQSAACQDTTTSFDPAALVDTSRVNSNGGGYPPVYYAVMGLFAGHDIQLSVMIMRFVNVLLFLGISVALYLLLPVRRRTAMLWGWLVATVPLGIYLIPSNNPSSWSVMGVATAWLALLGWFETAGRRKVGLGIVFGVAAVMAAGSRSDAALYVILGVAVVGVLTVARTRRWLLDAILPAVAVIACILTVVTSGQAAAAIDGFGQSPIASAGATGGAAAPAPDPIGLLFYNVLNVPSLWAGALGTWGLGWFDVALPMVVGFASIGCFVAVGFTGFRSMTVRKGIALAGAGLTLIVLPVYVLTRGGSSVGTEVQPRYLLPAIILLAGLLALRAGMRSVALTRGQLALVLASLAVIQFIALHTTIRRYVTGVDAQGFDLDAGIEWWWPGAPAPMVTLAVASLAYAAAVVILGTAANRLAAQDAGARP